MQNNIDQDKVLIVWINQYIVEYIFLCLKMTKIDCHGDF